MNRLLTPISAFALATLLASGANVKKPVDCKFDNPDTSVSNIKLQDQKSSNIILKTTLQGDTTYSFFSSDKKELLSVLVHPGDYRNQVSIFQVRYASSARQVEPPLKILHFKTEKNIRLGMSKTELIKKLGTCYKSNPDISGATRVEYNITSPDDSRTALLARHNMPVYYAFYTFRNNKLIEYEFGFEYP